ncbi:PAC2 family protein [Cellulomonas triticagri]|uniref:PAC2 family protein n=1 Tax=Cellulomonas triticagri TaxID=2483352 RepID=A0A3M2JHC6_9CELL|nr:PAC2 family protein [Cellulomonas triticagri]RMI13447.1 PAC2 family protein [Cellulomonas triticagri]
MTEQASTPAGQDEQGPILLAAFEGWNDAGSAASQALEHLHEVWGAEQVDELDPEEYHDFQVNRPVVGAGPDGRREITWPSTAVAVATAPRSGRTVVLVHGIEPSMRWRRYSRELLDIADGLHVQTVVTLGALLADVPHTRPIPVTATSEDAAVREELDVESNSYEGPTGIVGVLQHEAAARGLRTVSLWAAVPHYVAHPPSPKATLALLQRIEALTGESIPLGDLPEDAAAWQDGVDELAGEDEEIAEYVRQLEEAKDTADLPEASGEAIAQEFERYLRRRDKGVGG